MFPLKNITWDEFNILFKWLNKDIYYYEEDKIKNNEYLNLFVHNKKYKEEIYKGNIKEDLKKKIKILDNDIYKRYFDVSYKKIYDKYDENFLLNI